MIAAYNQGEPKVVGRQDTSDSLLLTQGGSQQSSEGAPLNSPRKPSAHQLPKADKAKQDSALETAAAEADCQSWPVCLPQLPAAWQLPQQKPGFPIQQQSPALRLDSMQLENCALGSAHTPQVDADAHVFAPPAQLQLGLLDPQIPASPLSGGLRSCISTGQLSPGAGILGQPGTEYLSGAGLWTSLPSIPEGPEQSSAAGLSDPCAQASAPSRFEAHQAQPPTGSSRSSSSAYYGISLVVITVRQGSRGCGRMYLQIWHHCTRICLYQRPTMQLCSRSSAWLGVVIWSTAVGPSKQLHGCGRAVPTEQRHVIRHGKLARP